MTKPVYLYITPFFPSPDFWRGGFCLDAVRSLMADGRYRVVVMTAAGEYKADYSYEGISVYKIPCKKLGASQYFEWFYSRRNCRYFIEKLREIEIRPEDVAVCHVHDYDHYIQYALALKKLNPKCLTLEHHHFAGYYKLDIGKFGIIPIWSDLLYLKMRREFESVDAHVFISEHCKACYGRRMDFDTGVDKGPLKRQLWWSKWVHRPFTMKDSYILYNGIDGSMFSRVDGEKCRKNKDEFVIGNVGNFNPCKRQIDLIRAMPRVLELLSRVEGEKCRKRIKVIFVGSGKTFAECKEAAQSIYTSTLLHGSNTAPLSFEFREPVHHVKMPEFYRSLDLLVTPSVNEGLCCVNLEANACGTPFMSVKGLPMEEVLSKEDQDKWLFKANDPEDIARQIAAYMDHPSKQKLSKNLDSDVLARKFLNWVEGMKGTL